MMIKCSPWWYIFVETVQFQNDWLPVHTDKNVIHMCVFLTLLVFPRGNFLWSLFYPCYIFFIHILQPIKEHNFNQYMCYRGSLLLTLFWFCSLTSHLEIQLEKTCIIVVYTFPLSLMLPNYNVYFDNGHAHYTSLIVLDPSGRPGNSSRISWSLSLYLRCSC